MYELKIHHDVSSDLESIQLRDSIAVTRFVAFVEEVKSNPSILIDALDTHTADWASVDTTVVEWKRLLKDGHKAWRIRFKDFSWRDPDYRIIFTVSESKKQIIILAFKARSEIDYDDPHHPFSIRITCALARHCR